MALQLNDEQLASFEALTGIDPGQLNDVTVAYLKSVSGSDSNDPQDLWYATLTGLGYTGAVQDMQLEYWADITGTTGQWNDLYYQWLIDTGGAFGPNVNIVLASGGSCTYEPPTTTDCTAVGTYTANDSGFTNPANTWLWTIEPPVIGVDLTDATLKTCTVTTPTADANVSFNLKVVATDSVSTDTAETTKAITQAHNDGNVLPVFVGPDVNDVQFQLNVAISPFDFSPVFTGTNLVYDNTGTLPTGLVIDPATGILTGTPTVEQVEPLTVTATNSKGVAVTNTFSMTIINQSQILTVAEVTPGACSFIFPATDCTSQGTYNATPSGWTLPPDTWVWSISSVTQGSPIITAGQGTDTVTVDDTGSIDAQFTMKCIASNTGESAQDLTQFVQTHTDNTVAITFDGPPIADPTFTVDELYTLDVSPLFSGDPIQTWALLGTWPNGSFVIDGAGVITGTAVIGDVGSYPGLGVRASNGLPDSADSNTFSGTVAEASTGPAFYALTPDETTYEMLGVSIGTGGLTTTHTADLYAADWEGVYRLFSANQPVWSGGFVGDNSVLFSHDLTNAAWTPVDSPVVTYDQIGLDGQPNTASLVEDNSVVDTQRVDQSGVGDSLGIGSQATARVYIKKDSDVTRFPEIQLLFTANNVGIILNTSTGDVLLDFTSGGGVNYTFESVDEGLWWAILIQGVVVGTGGIPNVRVVPARTTVFASGGEPSAVGSVIVGNVEYHVGKSRDDIRNLGWIYTTTEARTTAFATDNTGAPLAEIPYLQYYPAATNKSLQSSDLTTAPWSEASAIDAFRNEVGITGEPNTATFCDKTGTAFGAMQQLNIAVTSGQNIVVKVWVKKEVAQTVYPMFDTNGDPGVFLNTETGNAWNRTGFEADAIEVVDAGDWWILMFQYVAVGATTIARAIPAFANAEDGSTANVAGTVIIGQYEVHENKTIAEVRGLGPIFTTTAAVATDAVVDVHDSANSSDSDSTWYAEITSEGAQNIIDGFLSIVGTNFQLSDGTTTVTQPWTVSVLNKVGIVYDTTQMAINVNDTWSADVAYDGAMLQGILDLFRATSGFAGQIREYQRFDSATLAAGKAIIDGLMAEVLVAEDDSELTTETNDSLTKG